MKIFILFLVLSVNFVCGQIPSLKSFNTNQFSVADKKVTVKSGSLVTNLSVAGYLALSGTNQYADDGSNLTRNGVPITSGGAGGGGNVFNIGASTANAIPIYTDTTGTNTSPSLITVTGLTNLNVPGTLSFSSLVVTNYTRNGITNISTGAASFTADGPQHVQWTNNANTTVTMLNVPTTGASRFFFSTLGDGVSTNGFTIATHSLIWRTAQINTPGSNTWVDYDFYSFGNKMFGYVADGIVLTGAGVTNVAGILYANLNAATSTNIVFNTNANGAIGISATASGGGGGDTIWTNVSGTIQPLDGQTTNRLSFTSGAADNATNVAFQAGSANVWNADGALLGAFHHAGTNVAGFQAPFGGLLLGPSAFLSTSDSTILSAVFDESIGNPGSMSVGFVAQSDPGFTTYSELFFDMTASGSNGQIIGDATDGIGRFGQLTLSWNPAGPGINIQDESGVVMQFSPRVASTGSAIANFVGTSNGMTNGDTLFGIHNARNYRVKFDHAGTPQIYSTITAGGTTGAQTIDKPSGRVNIAAGQTSVVVTDALVTANSLIYATVASNDDTATLKNVVSASGSFTITLTAAATAETKVNFLVVNPL